MESPLVSVIIPIYNVEQYVERCIDSVVNQTYKNTEIFLINDGSTDKSLEVIQKYKDRCFIINKKNGGQSSARNMGLAKATGKYVYFIDADDYIVPNALEILVNSMEIEDIDICCFQFKSSDINGREYVLGPNFTVFGLEGNDAIIKDVLLGSNMKTSVCSRICRRSLLQEHNLSFVEGIFNEDVIFSDLIALHSRKVKFLKEPLYYVEQRLGSTSRTYTSKNLSIYFEVYEHVKEAFIEAEKYDIYKEYLTLQYAIGILFTLVGMAYNIDDYDEFCNVKKVLTKDNFFNREVISSTKLKGISFYFIAILSFHSKLFYLTIRLLKKMGYKRYC